MSDLARLTLPDGAWVTFRTSYGWGPSIRIDSTLIDGDGSEAFMRALVRETVTGWHVPSEAGTWLDWVATDEQPRLDDSAMDAVDGHLGDPILARCTAIWRTWKKGRPDPKGTSPSSTEQPPASE